MLNREILSDEKLRRKNVEESLPPQTVLLNKSNEICYDDENFVRHCRAVICKKCKESVLAGRSSTRSGSTRSPSFKSVNFDPRAHFKLLDKMAAVRTSFQRSLQLVSHINIQIYRFFEIIFSTKRISSTF